MDDAHILYEKRGAVALITLNRPAVLNAVRREMFRYLLDLFAHIRDDDSVRVVVITGNGRAFSAGIDLEQQSELTARPIDEADARARLAEMQDLTRQMRDLPKPIIAALNGLAVGVGAEIAIASDIRVAVPSAYFMFAEVRRALFETNGVMYLLPRLVGFGRALDWMLSGDKISAGDAHAAGLLTRLFPPESLLDEALALADRIAACAPIALRLVKQVGNQTYDLPLEAVMQLEVEGMMECLRSADYREGVQSFLEKRPPQYSGR
ncbi:MAG: enoyl-CoA hydratase/isomerase family protein [Anaerolineae bacterium]|jgi:enoyl-CoA hydratase/carnithine racemase|nr:enoyl-CoA hydratase/isomerase family protein [Anaerolineae bacterium]